jgi:archaellum component FlaG (FlaF/FlaG flagellin family)
MQSNQRPEPRVSILVDGTVVYRGDLTAVPREGDRLVHNGDVVRVQSVTWRFGEDQSTVDVEVAIGEREYTF